MSIVTSSHGWSLVTGEVAEVEKSSRTENLAVCHCFSMLMHEYVRNISLWCVMLFCVILLYLMLCNVWKILGSEWCMIPKCCNPQWFSHNLLWMTSCNQTRFVCWKSLSRLHPYFSVLESYVCWVERRSWTLLLGHHKRSPLKIKILYIYIIYIHIIYIYTLYIYTLYIYIIYIHIHIIYIYICIITPF